jgi:hypothetical protein
MCGAAKAGMEWPSHARSTPELDRLRAQLFPVDAGADPETLRRYTLKTAEALPMRAETC